MDSKVIVALMLKIEIRKHRIITRTWS